MVLSIHFYQPIQYQQIIQPTLWRLSRFLLAYSHLSFCNGSSNPLNHYISNLGSGSLRIGSSRIGCSRIGSKRTLFEGGLSLDLMNRLNTVNPIPTNDMTLVRESFGSHSLFSVVGVSAGCAACASFSVAAVS